MKNLTASDRKSLIRLTSALPKGSEERRAILAGLNFRSGRQKHTKTGGRGSQAYSQEKHEEYLAALQNAFKPFPVKPTGNGFSVVNDVCHVRIVMQDHYGPFQPQAQFLLMGGKDYSYIDIGEDLSGVKKIVQFLLWLKKMKGERPPSDARRWPKEGSRLKVASSLRSRLKPGSSHYVAVPKGVEYESWSDNWGPMGVRDGADLFEVWENYERRPLGRPKSEAAFPIRAQVINSNGRRGKSFHLPDDHRIVVLSELDGMNPKDALQEWYKLR